jgi:hypothetical protein
VGRRGMSLFEWRKSAADGASISRRWWPTGAILGAFHSTTLFDLGARHCDLVSFVDATLALYTQLATATLRGTIFRGPFRCCCCCCCGRAAVVSCQLQQRPIGCDLNPAESCNRSLSLPNRQQLRIDGDDHVTQADTSVRRIDYSAKMDADHSADKSADLMRDTMRNDCSRLGRSFTDVNQPGKSAGRIKRLWPQGKDWMLRRP